MKRRKRCFLCTRLFRPDPRLKSRQQYCSKPLCQRYRQRLNEKRWLARNPECRALKRQKTKAWFLRHRDYSAKRRHNDSAFCLRNRFQTKLRMQALRRARMFDKTKSILAQLVQQHGDKCYLSRGARWLHLRLTNPSRWLRGKVLWENAARWKPPATVLGNTTVYDITKSVFGRSP